MWECTRRHLFRSTLRDFSILCATLPRLAERAGAVGLPRLGWNAFVDLVEYNAKHEFRRIPSSMYVQNIAALTQRLDYDDSSSSLLRTRRGYRNVHLGIPEFSDLARTVDIQLSLVSFEPGETIPHHDHPQMTGVVTCLAGQLEVTSYDLLEGEHGVGGCLLRKVNIATLSRGGSSTLTDRDRNVHHIKARTFTQVIDIFTPPYDSARIKDTKWFSVEHKPLDVGGTIFAASALHKRKQ